MGAPSFPFFFGTLSKPWHISRSALIAPRQCRELKNRQRALHTLQVLLSKHRQHPHSGAVTHNCMQIDPVYFRASEAAVTIPVQFPRSCLTRGQFYSVWVDKGCWLTCGQRVTRSSCLFTAWLNFQVAKCPKFPKTHRVPKPSISKVFGLMELYELLVV